MLFLTRLLLDISFSREECRLLVLTWVNLILDLPQFGGHIMILQKEKEVSKPHNPKQPYPAQFREQMIELVRMGKKPSELAKEFGCHVSSILNWVRQANPTGSTSIPSVALNAKERQELVELRRKLRQVQMERDILAKATAWFAGKSEKTSTSSTRS